MDPGRLVEPADTILLKTPEILQGVKPREDVVSDGVVQAYEASRAPAINSLCISELQSPDDENTTAENPRGDGMDCAHATSVSDKPPLLVKDSAAVATKSAVHEEDSCSNQNTASTDRSNHTNRQHDGDNSLQHWPEVMTGPTGNLDQVDVAHPLRQDDQSTVEIPETQVESSIRGKETPGDGSITPQKSPTLSHQPTFHGNILGTSRRWSFPSSTMSSAYHGKETPSLNASCRQRRFAALQPSDACEVVLSNSDLSITATDNCGLSEGGGMRFIEPNNPRMDHNSRDQLASLQFDPAKSETQPQPHVTQTTTEPVRSSATSIRALSDETMPASNPTSPLVTLHPLSPADTLVLTAIANNTEQLNKLCKSKAAWSLPQSLSSGSLNVMGIKYLGNQSWLVLAKVSDGTLSNMARVTTGRSDFRQERSESKRKRRQSVTDGELESANDDPGPVKQQNKRHRHKQARKHIHISDDSQSETDYATDLSSVHPKMKRGQWTQNEDLRLTRMVEAGCPWSTIVGKFPRRSEPAVRSRWNCVLKPLAS